MISHRRERLGAGAGGFTLVELLVVIAIVGVLVGVLLPTLARARRNADDVRCQSNLRQIGIALRAYANDHRDRYPDDFTLGGAFYRRAPGDTDDSGVAERFGLAAVLHGMTLSDPASAVFTSRARYLDGRSGVWVCPSANERLRSFRNTYSWAAMPTRESTDAGNWTSRQRGRTVVFDGQTSPPAYQAFVQDEFMSEPFTSGVSLPGALPRSWGLLPTTMRLPPHSFRTRAASRTLTISGQSVVRRAGSANVLFFDGSIGRLSYATSGRVETIKE